MFVRNLQLRDYRSWKQVDVELRPGATVFVGQNGFGKTNLIESLHYLSTGRSHRSATDATLVRSGEPNAQVSASVVNIGRELTVSVHITAGKANKVTINGAPQRRSRDVIGILRTVSFAPEDLALVRGEPAERRRMLDDLAALTGPSMIAARSDYDKVLRQRSALLKTASAAMRQGGQAADSVISTLDVWDTQLAAHGARVMAGRINAMNTLRPLFCREYSTLAPHSRPIDLRYRPIIGDHVVANDGVADVELVEATLLAELAKSRSKEIDRGICLVGPHRDDLDITLDGQLAKSFASHGESWSLALALRLGSVQHIRDDGAEPVVLLDDVFAELDAARRTALARFAQSVEQVLITAAVGDDIPSAIEGRRIDVGVIDHDGGVPRESQILRDSAAPVSGGNDDGE